MLFAAPVNITTFIGSSIMFKLSALVSYAVFAFVIPFLFRTFLERVTLYGIVAASWVFLGAGLGCVPIPVAFVASGNYDIGFNFAGLPV